jgi:anti-sigma B factor antagonist
MDLKLDRGDRNVTFVSLSGKLDYDGAEVVEDKFRHLLDSHNTHFLVDISEVSYIAEMGVRLLAVGVRMLARKGKKLIVLNPQPLVNETLVEGGGAKLIPIARDQEEALKRLMVDATGQDVIT